MTKSAMEVVVMWRWWWKESEVTSACVIGEKAGADKETEGRRRNRSPLPA